MKRHVFLVALSAFVFMTACDRKPSKPEQYSPERLRADYKADKLRSFRVRMQSPTKTGQIVTANGLNGEEVFHVVGDLGLAHGDYYDGYFEPAGMYEYTNASGGAARVHNYIWRGFAGDDMKADVDEAMEKYRKRTHK